MMYIITSKQGNAIVGIGNVLQFQSNGYPWLVEENTAYVKEEVNVFETDHLSKEIVVHKYCYTEEQGFYPNPNYHEPTVYDRVQPLDVAEIEANYTAQLIKEGVI